MKPLNMSVITGFHYLQFSIMPAMPDMKHLDHILVDQIKDAIITQDKMAYSSL